MLNLYLCDLKGHIQHHNSAISAYSIKLKNCYDSNGEYKEAVNIIKSQIYSLTNELKAEKLNVEEERKQSNKERAMPLSCKKITEKCYENAYYTQRPVVSKFNQGYNTHLSKEFTFGD